MSFVGRPPAWVQYRLEERLAYGRWVEPANAWGQNYTSGSEEVVQGYLEGFVSRGWDRTALRIVRNES